MFTALSNVVGQGSAPATPEMRSAWKLMTPAQKKERIRRLWGKLRAACISGMAGWLCRHAHDASSQQDAEAQSVRDVIFPKFNVGDTMELPSRVIPFVAAARFLRGYLSSSGTDQSDDLRRTIACRLMLSQHGIATVMSAFWFVVLRRFRWRVEDNQQQQQQPHNSMMMMMMMMSSSGSGIGASFSSVSPTPTAAAASADNNNDASCGRPPSGLGASSSSIMHHHHHHHQNQGNRSGMSRSASASPSMSQTQRPGSAMSTASSSPQHSLRSLNASNFEPPPNVDAEAKRYGQGLLFNACFHFSQIYAQHGRDIRSAATLQLFCQLFAATLLNFLKTEFWDAGDDVSVNDEEGSSEQHRKKRRRSPDGKRDTSHRPRYISTTSGDGSETLERYVGELSVSWFFGDNVGEALQSFFASEAFQGGTKSAHEGAVSAAEKHAAAEDEEEGGGDGGAAEGEESKKNGGKEVGTAAAAAAEDPLQQSQRSATGAPSGSSARRPGSSSGKFLVPARHQMDSFMRKAKALEAQVQAASSPSSRSRNRARKQHRQNNDDDDHSDIIMSAAEAEERRKEEELLAQQQEQQAISAAIGASVAYSGVPIKLEGRRSHELLAQQKRNRLQQRASSPAGSAAAAAAAGENGKSPPQLSSLQQIHKQMREEQQKQIRAGAPKRASATEVTDDMEVLVHTKDGRSSIRREDAGVKKRQAFFDSNRSFLDHCRARLKVQGVSVDEIKRGVPFPLSTRSQLLQLSEVLAAHHVTNLASQRQDGISDSSGHDTSTRAARGGGSSSAATLHHALHQNRGALSVDSGMTNAFTPRPEASLALNTKDAARRAGYDSTRKPTRCPFCHPHPHTLQLNVAAMRLTRQADKAAAKCRSCFEVKSGFLPMMNCTRCSSVLCVDCVKVVEVPVVETVLSKAALSAATRSFSSVVEQLWGSEISGTIFGPIMPPLTRARAGATLDDLGVALTPASRRSTSAASVTPSAAAATTTLNNTNLLSVRSASGSSSKNKTPLGILKRDQRRRDQAMLEDLFGTARGRGESPSRSVFSGGSASSTPSPGFSRPPSALFAHEELGVASPTHATASASASAGGGISPPPLPTLNPSSVMHPAAAHDNDDDDGVFNLTESRNSPPRPPISPLHYRPSSPQQQHQQQHNLNRSNGTTSSALDRVPRPSSSLSCCHWMTPGHLQGRIMRTGGRIDSEVFSSDSPVEQHASGIGAAWKARHLVKMTRTPNLDRGNLGRLRAHIHRSLAHARAMVDQAAADTERERVEAQQQTRRLKEMSSRDMIRQFRSEAASASQRLNGGAMDDRFHRRRMAAEVEAYAARFAGSGSAVQNPQAVEAAVGMLDALANNPSLCLLPAAARRKIIGFIVHEKHSIDKAQLAAARLTDLLSWSQAQGETVTLEELIETLELEKEQIAELRAMVGLKRDDVDDSDTPDGKTQKAKKTAAVAETTEEIERRMKKEAEEEQQRLSQDFETDKGALLTQGSNNVSAVFSPAASTENLTSEVVPPVARWDKGDLEHEEREFLRARNLSVDDWMMLPEEVRDEINFGNMSHKILKSINERKR